MKIGILTFHKAINFGAVLQAFGLQEALKQLGHNACIVDYAPTWDNSTHGSFIFEVKKTIKRSIFYPVNKSRSFKFKRFQEKYLNIESLDLNDRANDFDAFILGSDQIWNPSITANGFDYNYFGRFPAADEKLRIGYAGSVGSTKNLSEPQKKEFISLVGTLDGVSARETELNSFILNNGVKSNLVLDPVLLAGRRCFETMAQPNIRKKPYLLVFQIDRNPDVLMFAKRIAEVLGLNLLEIVPMVTSLGVSFKNQTASPSDFISFIKNAEYIVTGSFHATAFSILFHKQFTVIENASRSNRMKSLLDSLGLEQRLASLEDEPQKEKLLSTIDYISVDQKLETLRRESVEFLNTSLSNGI